MGIGQVNKLEKEAFREREMNFIIQLKAFQFVHFVVRIEQLKNVMNESLAPRLHIAHLRNVEKEAVRYKGKLGCQGIIS